MITFTRHSTNDCITLKTDSISVQDAFIKAVQATQRYTMGLQFSTGPIVFHFTTRDAKNLEFAEGLAKQLGVEFRRNQ